MILVGGQTENTNIRRI